MSAATISLDEFVALEQKVLQTVELIKKEREARATAESERDAALADLATAKSHLAAATSEAEALRTQLAAAETKLTETEAKLTTHGDAATELAALQQERESTRKRVEGMLAKLDELI